jgi:predicted DCC family thiol-disulfide oxidoreductase YuxK
VVARLDTRRRLAILPIDHPVARALLAGRSDAERHASWHLVLRDGRVLDGGGRAGAPVLRRLPLTSWFGVVAARLRLEPLLARVDRFFAWARRYLARIVPGGPGPTIYP